ncbi:MAG: sialidase family protein [Nitrososphaeraceae archaeon]
MNRSQSNKISDIIFKRFILNSILTIFVLSSLNYYYEINAIQETPVKDSMKNSLFEQLVEKNDKRIINYPGSNITNLTNNNEDSIYGQIEAFENNVYVVWQESVTKSFPKHNYDIFFIKSEDRGKTFSDPINLSNNPGFSEHPQIAVSQNGVFVVWADNTGYENNKEIMFTKSIDNGKTFSDPINLSNNSKVSFKQEISTFDKNIYVVWQDTPQDSINGKNSSIIFRSSNNIGDTFNDSIELINNTTIDSFPKVNSFKNYVYVVWNDENKKNSGMFFVRSTDNGLNFDDIIKLNNDNSFGESQIAVNQNEVLVIWGGFLAKKIDTIYYVMSIDNGKTFTEPKLITEKIIFNDKNEQNELNKIVKYPMNVELAIKNNLSYVVWQNTFSQQNEDIILSVFPKNEQDNLYTKILNLSNNTGISECPSIAISDNNIYIIWEDYTPGNHEILYTRIPIIY